VPDDLALPPAPPPAADPGSSRRHSHFEIRPFTRLCEAFHAAVEGYDHNSAVAVPTFHDGLASMRILDAMRASAADGGTLKQV
jgi:predicted dehydrogenase